jgi:SAM-dependent methyltransferase
MNQQMNEQMSLQQIDTTSTKALLATWYQSAYGQYVQAWLSSQIDPIVDRCFGNVAVQYGVAPHSFLAANRMPYQFGINTQGAIDLPFVRTDEVCWPFASDSLDLIVLPHVLEYVSDPYALMRASVDALNHEGYLLFIHMNPLCFWHRYQQRQKIEWVKQTFSAQALFKDLRVLGLELVESRFGCYCPAFTSAEKFQKYAWLDKVGDRWCGHFGGVYYFLARKRTWCEKWVGKIRFAKTKAGLKPVLAKSSHFSSFDISQFESSQNKRERDE